MNAKHIYPAFDSTRPFTVDELFELTGRVAELEKQLAEARQLLREMWTRVVLPDDLLIRADELVNRE